MNLRIYKIKTNLINVTAAAAENYIDYKCA